MSPPGIARGWQVRRGRQGDGRGCVVSLNAYSRSVGAGERAMCSTAVLLARPLKAQWDYGR